MSIRSTTSKSAWAITLPGGYGAAFRDDHLLPMASAIWSASPSEILAYPAAAFIRFHDNHGLLQFRRRPVWETVVGGSRNYVQRLILPFADRIRLDTAVHAVRRRADGVMLTDSNGHTDRYDHVVMATHADQALAMLADRSPRKASFSAHFVTAAILQFYTQTTVSCRSGGRCGRAGTTLAHGMQCAKASA